MGDTYRLFCVGCGKRVSNDVPDSVVIRAVYVCPECIEAKRLVFPEKNAVVSIEEGRRGRGKEDPFPS
jgi:DNA-directed RNA polymerase subunit RPC12/RpoP